jgi:hypothetical protein
MAPNTTPVRLSKEVSSNQTNHTLDTAMLALPKSTIPAKRKSNDDDDDDDDDRDPGEDSDDDDKVVEFTEVDRAKLLANIGEGKNSAHAKRIVDEGLARALRCAICLSKGVACVAKVEDGKLTKCAMCVNRGKPCSKVRNPARATSGGSKMKDSAMLASELATINRALRFAKEFCDDVAVEATGRMERRYCKLAKRTMEEAKTIILKKAKAANGDDFEFSSSDEE